MTPRRKADRPQAEQVPAADAPTLDERFQYELQKRSSLEGIAQAAMGGDRKAIRSLAGAAESRCSQSPEAEEPVLDWLVYALGRIRRGEEPNVAFGWKRQQRGAPKPSQDFESLRKQWLVGQHMVGLVASGLSQAEAAREVSAARHVSEAEAKRCHRSFKQFPN